MIVWCRRGRINMASQKCKILLCFFTLFLFVRGELNLEDGSPCVDAGFNGTCVSLYRCGSATIIYTYINAGYGEPEIPPMPEICSYKGDTPIVCCTDCKISDDEINKGYVVTPNGSPRIKKGPKALDKCYDYFQRLPYPCRGNGVVEVERIVEDKNPHCHQYGIHVSLAVGGRNAERWEFPHMALLGFGDEQESAQWLCGGTVISERYILTAAHCVNSGALGRVAFAALGLLKRSDPLELWKVHKIKRAVIHPEYKPPSKYNDIALLETETEIEFGKDLLPACLDTGDTRSKYDDSADASGWGQLGHKNPLADTLQVVTLREYNETECSTSYPIHRHMKRGYDHATQMCFGSHSKVTDTCQGDSGGPLQYNDRKCLYFALGVTSTGRDCGTLGTPGIYTRVSHYVPWIEDIVWPE
ncbi:mast cell protease 1A-like [Anticarsia gemmatalis]|uniref:mast cell protease 1A-like n=1 Tax=Anticarsia gemmatalis TaxID=129554 RepID=UPI003F75B6EC